MKIKIYYGGRGLLDDPTLYVLDKMEDVLKELRVTVERYNNITLKHCSHGKIFNTQQRTASDRRRENSPSSRKNGGITRYGRRVNH